MGIIQELQSFFVAVSNSAIFNILWMPFTIAAGVLVGVSTNILSMHIATKAISYTLQTGEILEQDEKDERTAVVGDFIGVTPPIGKARVLTDILDMRNNSLLKYGCMCNVSTLIAIPSCLFSGVLLGPSGFVSFVITHVICIIMAPRLDQYRFTISYIEEIVHKAGYRPKDVKKISRKFYKTFRSWLKPNRSNDEIFLTANTILEEYAQQLENP